MTSFKHFDWDSVEWETLNPKIQRQFFSTETLTIGRLILKKGAFVPTHHHPNEQMTFILEGALKFVLDGREVVVKSGETLCIPPNLPHSAEALEDTIDVDVFTPPRQDWIDKNDAYLRK